jgi:D-arabinose 1-dehydrogenase-like Zn-dependent alcohol dehydrogenase|eukprot:SAG25_NODE_1680_length_2563_cov_65.625000_1_plen_74_part_00
MLASCIWCRRRSYLGAHAEYSEMFAFAAAHKVVPQVQTVPLAQVNEAVARCKAGTARYRMVLCMDSSGGVAGL